MTFDLQITQQAQEDITRNAAWWAENHSLEEALAWYDAVYEQLDSLTQFPESHALAREDSLFDYEIRELLVGGKRRTYRAIFTVVKTEVRVLTVRRGAQRAVTPDDVLPDNNPR